MIKDIYEFMRLGGQYVPEKPNFDISPFETDKYLMRVEEEVEETGEAIWGNEASNLLAETGEWVELPNLPETVDGYLDIAYVAITGALNAAGYEATQKCWDAIVDANLSKVDGRFEPPARDENGKIIKPRDWVAPDIEGILNGTSN